ncbi:MAG: FHA domain-containing protein [Chloroflexi bacterium]|nr:FHA domain-containing protein [Chloroflexota bacterium]
MRIKRSFLTLFLISLLFIKFFATENPALAYPLTGSDTVLVFDTSGSMDERDKTGVTKLEAAQLAGIQILNVIEAENAALGSSNQVGLVTYDRSVEILSPLVTDITALKDAFSDMYAYGGTGMADGLKAGIELFATAQGNKVIILLSDGLPNISLNSGNIQDYDVIKQQVIDLSTQAGQLGICVNTVGFGDPGKGTSSIDEAFLIMNAEASGCGRYVTAIDAVELVNVYMELRHSSTGSIQFQHSGQISDGEEIDLGPVTIPDYQELFLFTLNWPGDIIQPILIDPFGVKVDNTYPGISINETASLISYILNNPSAGDWHLKLLGLDIPTGVTDYNAILSTRAGAIPTPTTPPTQVVQAAPTGAGGLGVFLLILVAAGVAIAVYVYSQTLKKNRGKEILSRSTGAKIRGEKGEYRERVINLHDGFVVGRGSLSDLKLEDSSISRRHCIFRYSKGNWYIQDLGSSSGTYVNRKRVDGARLVSGDQISFGNNTITFLSE